jgi:4-nitrophenyl phosphatase
VPTPATTSALLERYDGILLDIFGVLVDGSGPLPGAVSLLDELTRRGTPFALVTNDASRSVGRYVEKFADFGVAIDPARFVTSGSLVPGYFAANGLAGARTCVLGPPDSAAYVRAGGGIVVPLQQGLELDVLAVCDDAGFEFLAGIEWALSAVVRAVEAGRRPHLVLPNPDLVYPKSRGELGFTAGAIALVVEAALARRFPGEHLAFARLGKPEPHLFTDAAHRLGLSTDRLVMIGDQLETDVAGARAAGCDAALVAGVSRWSGGPIHVTPTWLLDRLWP